MNAESNGIGINYEVDGREGAPWVTFSEAEIVQRIFRMVAEERGTAMGVARRLNDEGIPMWRKYHPKSQREAQYKIKPGARWWPSTIARIIRSETYRGTHIWDAGGRSIVRETPALVSSEQWDKAQTQLESNKSIPKHRSDHLYLLRSLIRCANCGGTFTGNHSIRSGWERYYYKCSGQTGEQKVPRGPCTAKMISAEWIEAQVWEDISGFLASPGDVIYRLQERMESELTSIPSAEQRRKELSQVLVLKENEKDRLLDAYRRGLMEIDELEDHIKQSREEMAPLQTELASVISGEAEVGRHVGQLTDAKSLLEALKDRLEGPLDFDTKRQMVESLVSSISVTTTGEGRSKSATVDVTYAFEESIHGVNSKELKIHETNYQSFYSNRASHRRGHHCHPGGDRRAELP